MNRGTRRMWARRALRAGWLLAPILQAPMWVLRKIWGAILWCTCDSYNSGRGRQYEFSSSSTFLTVVLLSFFGLAFGTIFLVEYRKLPASNEQIREAVEGNPCMIEAMSKQALPILRRDLRDGIAQCELNWTNYQISLEQQKILNTLKEKP